MSSDFETQMAETHLQAVSITTGFVCTVSAMDCGGLVSRPFVAQPLSNVIVAKNAIVLLRVIRILHRLYLGFGSFARFVDFAHCDGFAVGYAFFRRFCLSFRLSRPPAPKHYPP